MNTTVYIVQGTNLLPGATMASGWCLRDKYLCHIGKVQCSYETIRSLPEFGGSFTQVSLDYHRDLCPHLEVLNGLDFASTCRIQRSLSGNDYNYMTLMRITARHDSQSFSEILLSPPMQPARLSRQLARLKSNY